MLGGNVAKSIETISIILFSSEVLVLVIQEAFNSLFDQLLLMICDGCYSSVPVQPCSQHQSQVIDQKWMR